MVIELTSVGDADLQVNHSLLFVQAQPGPVAPRQTLKIKERLLLLTVIVVADDLENKTKKKRI